MRRQCTRQSSAMMGGWQHDAAALAQDTALNEHVKRIPLT
jgi:hypothetical protein